MDRSGLVLKVIRGAHGSLHFLSIIKKIRFLSEEVQKLIQQSLRRNSFFAHHENVILSLMCDEDIQTRRNALQIYEIVCSNSESQVFNLSPVNFDAETLYDIQI